MLQLTGEGEDGGTVAHSNDGPPATARTGEADREEHRARVMVMVLRAAASEQPVLGG